MRRPHLLACAAALLVGLALRLVALTAGTLELDESYTVIQASQPVATILRLAPTDPNPPLTNLAFHAWTSVLGTSEFVWESLSVVLALIAMVLLARLGARRFGPTTGVVAVWLLALSPVHVLYSQQMRSYSLALVWALWALDRLLCELDAPRRSDLLGWLAGCWLLVNTHYYGLFVVAAFFLAALLAHLAGWTPHGRAAGARRVLLAGIGLGIALTPTLGALYLQYTRYYSFDWIPKPSASLVVDLFAAFGGVAAAGDGAAILAAGLWTMALVGGGALWIEGRRRDGRRRELLVLGAWLLLPMLLAFTVSALGRPFLHPRYVVLWLVPLLLLTARGVAALPQARHQAVAVALLGLAAATPLVGYYGNRLESGDAQRAFDHIAEHYQEGDIVLHLSKVSWAPAIYHHGGALEEYFLHGTPGSNVMRYWMPETKVEIDLPELADYRRVWVYRWPRLPEDFTAMAERFAEVPVVRALGPRLVEVDAERTLFLYALEGSAAARK